MKFIKNKHDNTKFVDGVFQISGKAKEDKDPMTMDCSIGSLKDEKGKLVTYKTVFDSEKEIKTAVKAGYCSNLQGDPKYLEAIDRFVLEGKVSTYHQVLATAGGTGGVSLPMLLCPDEGSEILIPEICWGNYKTMIQENNLKPVSYDIYDLNSLFNRIDSNKDKRLFLIINSPCENPCGHSYSYNEWEKIIEKLNSLKKEVVLVNDVAYLHYAGEGSKEYFKLFNNLRNNVMVMIAYSVSKSFSYYGYRLGALIMIHNDKELVDSMINLFIKKGRSVYSSVNAGAMANIANVLNKHYPEYVLEKEKYKKMLKARANEIIKHLDSLGIEYYKYTEGFFVTLKILNDSTKERVHEELMKRHIYTIKVNKGIRIGLCGIAKKNIKRLCENIKDVM